jgi:tetratricopeptide (TPR) repeat protein
MTFRTPRSFTTFNRSIIAGVIAVAFGFGLGPAHRAFAAGPQTIDIEPDEPAGPESSQLTHAKKLYKKQDYPAASIEFFKILRGETKDSESGKQQAEFFLGKTLFNMGFYAASLRYFDKIVETGSAHRYYSQTLRWLAALQKVLPESSGILAKIGKYQRQDFEDKSLESVRPELYYLLGRYYFHEGKLDEAIQLFQAVPEDSDWYIAAKYFEGVTWVLVPKGREALDAFKQILTIASEPSLRRKYKDADVRDYEERAFLAMARVFYSTTQYTLAIKYYEKIPQESADWLDALFESSWAYYMIKNNSKALGNIQTLFAPYFDNAFYPESIVLKAQIYFNYCRYDRALEAVAEYQQVYPPLRDELRKVAKENADDDAEFFKLARKIQTGTAGLPERVQLLAATSLKDRTLVKTFQYVDELQKEIAAYESAEKAWKTTAIAKDVLQELTVEKSLAEAEAGKLARERIKRLIQELGMLNSDARAVKISTLEAQVGKKKEELRGREVVTIGKTDIIDVDDEHFLWGYNGESWKDELGFYRYRIASHCKKGK